MFQFVVFTLTGTSPNSFTGLNFMGKSGIFWCAQEGLAADVINRLSIGGWDGVDQGAMGIFGDSQGRKTDALFTEGILGLDRNTTIDRDLVGTFDSWDNPATGVYGFTATPSVNNISLPYMGLIFG